MAKTCSFGALCDEMIRDQIVEKISSSKIRERLLMEKDLNLEKTMQIARRIEGAVRESKTFANEHSFTQKSTPPVCNVKKKFTKKFESKPIQCYRCGLGHLANDPSCKAKDNKCSKCSKVGHLSSFCHGSKYSRHVRRNVHCVQSVIEKESSSSSCELDVQDFQVLAMYSSNIPCQPVYCTVMMNDMPLKLMVDTGSSVSIISTSTFNKFFASQTLKKAPSSVQLTSYTKHPIHVIGCFSASVFYVDRSTISTIYVVQNGFNIIGRDLVKSLSIDINGSTLSCNNVNVSDGVSTSNVVPLPNNIIQFKSMFTEDDILNSVKGFVHKVHVDKSVKPKRQKLRPLPFSVRNKVSDELQKLEASGIIEKVNSSEWVSPIVVSVKKSGKLRICIDLREVNKSIIPDKYPLPKIDELFNELCGATVFTQLDLASAYHQLLLHPESRDLTCFITYDGLYRFRRVCFGISSAPSAFQKMMSSILAGMSGVQCYLDDVVIYGKTAEEHNQNLHNVLSKLDSYGIKLNHSKC